MNNNRYIDYVLDTLFSLQLGNMKSRKMFGGYGIYQDGIFFALIANNILYFKVGDSNRLMYESHGSKPFSYAGKNNTIIVMSYWEVPADILESHNKLIEWVKKAVEAARQAKKSLKPKAKSIKIIT
jgi:DNA transformation protein and related proteins